MELMSRRSLNVIKDYEWLAGLAESLMLAEGYESEIHADRCELVRWQIGGDLSKYSIEPESKCARLEERIKRYESVIEERYKACRRLIDFVYEFNSIEFRVLYDFLTTTDSLYLIGKPYKLSANKVALILDQINQATSNILDDFQIDPDSKLLEMDPLDYLRMKVWELYGINLTDKSSEDVITPVKTLTQGMV